MIVLSRSISCFSFSIIIIIFLIPFLLLYILSLLIPLFINNMKRQIQHKHYQTYTIILIKPIYLNMLHFAHIYIYFVKYSERSFQYQILIPNFCLCFLFLLFFSSSYSSSSPFWSPLRISFLIAFFFCYSIKLLKQRKILYALNFCLLCVHWFQEN